MPSVRNGSAIEGWTQQNAKRAERQVAATKGNSAGGIAQFRTGGKGHPFERSASLAVRSKSDSVACGGMPKWRFRPR